MVMFNFQIIFLQLGRDIVVLLESARFKFNTQVGEIKNLPVLIDDNKVKWSITNIIKYTKLYKSGVILTSFLKC